MGGLAQLDTVGRTVSSILGVSSLQALLGADKKALIWEHGSRTYRELRERAMHLASALQNMGLKPGDRVASILLNRGEIFELYFACAYAGLVYVPLSFRLAESEIKHVLEDSEAKVIFFEDEFKDRLLNSISLFSEKPSLVQLTSTVSGSEYESLIDKANIIKKPVFNDTHMILYTSGTTGKPKGVVMRNSGIVWSALQQASQIKFLDSSSVSLLNGPLYNTATINELSIPTFLTGGTVAIIPSRGWSAEKFTHYVDKWSVTHVLVFPTMFRSLINSDTEEKLHLDSLKWWYSGGESCLPSLMQEIQNRWPSIYLAIYYGSTESGLPTLIEADDINKYPGSVGRVVSGHAIKLLDEDGDEVADGEIGEVWTAGLSVVREYWKEPNLTNETIKNGWLNIGDLARFDSEGYLYIVGRSKDIIISKGQNIYPVEIEVSIRSHPAVLDVAVFGIPDKVWGESVCAAIILRTGEEVTEDQILLHVTQQIASYKKPSHIFFIHDFPKKNDTKVDKKSLADICQKLLS